MAGDARVNQPGNTGNSRAGRGKERKSRTRIKIASLNIKGYKLQGAQENSNKWYLVNQIMREKKIAILVVQETHLNKERTEAINTLFENNIKVINSEDPEKPTAAKGVAFVINKKILPNTSPKVMEIVKGQVVLLEISWSERESLKIMNIYGPNDTNENGTLWEKLENEHEGRINILLGDFNIVEEAADRIPAREDGQRATKALESLKRKWGVADGWRMTNPGKRAFTFHQKNATSQSRLDRIYIRNSLKKGTDSWEIVDPGIPTDHKLVSCEIENREAPYIGKGRWIMPLHLIKDKIMTDRMKELALKLEEEMEALNQRSEEKNPQTLYANFKRALVKEARQRAKEKTPKIQKRINEIKLDLEEILRKKPQEGEEEMDTEKEIADRAAMLQQELTRLEEMRFGTTRKEVATRNWVKAETMTKYWTR
ncbi:Endonuclease/exonuclease/phosphatase, partial [Trametes maxima]